MQIQAPTSKQKSTLDSETTMKILMKFAAASLLTSSIIGSAAAEVSGRNAPALAESFVTQIQAGDATAAYALIQPHWPQDPDEYNFQVDRAQNHIADRPSQWGQAAGIETYLSTKTTWLRDYSYLVKFEYHVEIWNVQFYKNSSTGNWMVNEIQYNPLPNAFNE